MNPPDEKRVIAHCDPQTDSDVRAVPLHVEETVTAIAQLHASHYKEAGKVQRVVSRITTAAAQPRSLAIITVVLGLWILANFILPVAGVAAFDPAPYALLSVTVSAVALYLTAMILISRRHDDLLATRRDQLTLELGILAEQKSAKIIALLEQYRRNDPNQGNHRDEVAEEMSKPANPYAVLDAIRAAHENRAIDGIDRSDAPEQ
jgi:uncharacterized membrane protein